MKTFAQSIRIILGGLVASIFCVGVSGQEVQRGSKPADTSKSKPLMTAPPGQAPATLLKKELIYSGFLVDLARAEKPSRMLSLRNPADPKRDAANIYRNPLTGKAIGFKLWSLDF